MLPWGAAERGGVSALPALEALLREQWRPTQYIERLLGLITRHVFHRYGVPVPSLRRAWKKACEAAEGVPDDALFHDLRRSAVRELVRAGVPEQVAMKLTGHRTRSIFDRYAIVDEALLREGVEKLAGHRAASWMGAVMTHSRHTQRPGGYDAPVRIFAPGHTFRRSSK